MTKRADAKEEEKNPQISRPSCIFKLYRDTDEDHASTELTEADGAGCIAYDNFIGSCAKVEDDGNMCTLCIYKEV